MEPIINERAEWKLEPFRGSSFGLFFAKPPNLFHRIVQRLVFGFRWVKQS